MSYPTLVADWDHPNLSRTGDVTYLQLPVIGLENLPAGHRAELVRLLDAVTTGPWSDVRLAHRHLLFAIPGEVNSYLLRGSIRIGLQRLNEWVRGTEVQADRVGEDSRRHQTREAADLERIARELRGDRGLE
jgi:hypothetical protein